MKELVSEIENKNYDFFLDLIQHLDFVSVRKEATNKEIIMSVAKGMKQAKLASEGKIKSRLAKDFFKWVIM